MSLVRNTPWNCNVGKRSRNKSRRKHSSSSWITRCINALAFTVLIFSLIPTTIIAQGGRGVSARAVGSTLLELEPRQISVVSFLVENHLNRPVTLLETLDLPTGWQPLTIASPFTLAANSSEIRLISFRVPVSASAQRYSFTYRVSDIDNPGLNGEDKLQIVVLPVVKLEISADEAPHSVIAGQQYRVRLTVANFSNVAMHVAVQANHRAGDFPLTITPAEFDADPGESRQITVEVNSNEKLRHKIDDVVVIKVTGTALTLTPQTAEIVDQKSIRVQVLPRVTGTEDLYQRLPINASVITTNTDKGENANQLELRGGGILNPSGDTYVDFLLRSEGLQAGDVFGLREEYRLLLRHRNTEWHLGDFTYGLTPLTELGRYGRGISAISRFNELSLGAYQAQEIQRNENKQSGAFVAYQFTDMLTTSINYLQTTTLEKNGERQEKIGSIEIGVNPSRAAYMALEYGKGNSDASDIDTETRDAEAYRMMLIGSSDNGGFNYQLEHIYAGPNFGGYYHDQELTRAAFGLGLTQRLRLQSYYNEFETNLLLDPSRGNATNQRRGSVGFQYKLPFNTQLAVNFEQSDRRNLFTSDEQQNNGYQLSLSGAWNKLSLLASFARGRLESNNLNDNRDTSRNLVSAQFSPGDNQSYRLYYERSDTRYFLEDLPERFEQLDYRDTSGFSARFWWRNRLWVLADYRYSDDSPSQLTTQLEYLRVNGHRLSLSARYVFNDEVDRNDDSIVSLSYSVPIAVPIRRRTEIGALKGRVFDSEHPQQQGIADVIVLVNGAIAVTDKNGEFLFPSLSATAYQLVLENQRENDQRITAAPTPMPVNIIGGETVSLNVAMVRAASLSGQIRIFESVTGAAVFEENDEVPAEALNDVRGLANAKLQLVSEVERINFFTGADGAFEIPDLRPGQWTLRVLQSELPRFHRIQGASASSPYFDIPIQLRPGEKLDKVFKVLPVTRAIEIIDNGVVSR